MSYLSALVYSFLSQSTNFDIQQFSLEIFRWGFWTFILYALPITVAAGAAMYHLDQAMAGVPLTRIDYIFGALLTFISSAMLCTFVNLALGIFIPKISGGNPQPIVNLLPWVIPPALVATAFMLVSAYPSTFGINKHERLFM